METTKRNMPPAIPNMDEGDEEKSKVSKGGAVGVAVGVGVAAAAGGAVAGATVLSDVLGKKHYDLDDDEDEDQDQNEEGDENDGYYDDDKNLYEENEKETEKDNDVLPDDRRRDPRDDDDDDTRREPRVRRDPRDDDDDTRRGPRLRRDRDDNNGDGRNDDDGGNIDDRTNTIIERDEIEVDIKDGEWSPVGWRTITDQDGNEVNGMLFEDGNGGYVLITEGEPGSGIYDVAMNPSTGETMPIDDQFAFTRGDLEAIDNPDGGYIAPGAEDEIFAENDDINQDIIVTDNGDLTAQRDMPNGGEDTFVTDDTIYDDEEIDGPVDEEIIEDDEIAMADEDIILDDQVDTVIEDDAIAMVDEEVIVDDEELEQYLGEDEVAEVNDEPVEFVDNSQEMEMVADNNTYIPEDAYDDSMEMEADIYDDGGVDMV